MFRRGGWIGGLLLVLLAVIVMGGGAYLAYQAGFADGAVAEGLIPAEGLESTAPRYYHPYPGFGFFGIGRFFFGLLIFFLCFGFIKRLFFFPLWWGWRGLRHGRGPWGWKGMHPWVDEDRSDEPDSDQETANL